MPFFTEPDHYEKTILSDLQGAWSVLRAEVVTHAGFPNWERVLFHTDEAMSWETVRHLERMEPLLLLICNRATQGDAPLRSDGTSAGPLRMRSVWAAGMRGRPMGCAPDRFQNTAEE